MVMEAGPHSIISCPISFIGNQCCDTWFGPVIIATIFMYLYNRQVEFPSYFNMK